VSNGPARGLTPEEVATTSHALEQITEAQFREKFDLEALAQNDIYPRMWDEGNISCDYVNP
jgi:hypothetical protein